MKIALIVIVVGVWFLPTAWMVWRGARALVAAWRSRSALSFELRTKAAAGALLLMLGTWLNPVGHHFISTWQHGRVLAAVLEFRGRPLTEAYAQLGPPVMTGNGIPTYPSALVTFLDNRYVRIVELQRGIMSTAYIDD